MTFKQLRIAILIAAAVAASGCGLFKRSKASTPVVGERIAVLTTESDVEIDPATAAVQMTLTAPVANSEWTQSGGNASKAMGHVALGASLGEAWQVGIGQGTTLASRLAASPIV